MAPVPELRGHRYRPTTPSRRPAMRLSRPLLWHLLALWYFSREQSPSCLRSQEEVQKCLCSETLPPSEHLRHCLRLCDSDKCQILLCFYLPCDPPCCFVC